MVTVKRFSAAKWDALTEDEMLDQAYLRSQYRRGISDATQYASLMVDDDFSYVKDPEERRKLEERARNKIQAAKAHSGITSLNRAKEDLSRMSKEERSEIRKKMRYALAEHMGYDSPESMNKNFNKDKYAGDLYRSQKGIEIASSNTVGGIGLGGLAGGSLGAALGKSPVHMAIGGLGGAIVGGYLGSKRGDRKVKELMGRDLYPHEISQGKMLAYNRHASL